MRDAHSDSATETDRDAEATSHATAPSDARRRRSGVSVHRSFANALRTTRSTFHAGTKGENYSNRQLFWIKAIHPIRRMVVCGIQMLRNTASTPARFGENSQTGSVFAAFPVSNAA